MKKKLAIITTHPIQYNAPLFEMLAQRNIIDIKVFYTWGESVMSNKFDPGFGKVIKWDIPLLKGYNYMFLENTATDKGSHHFKGIVNPGIITAIKEYKADAVLVYGWSFKSHLKVLRYFKNKIPVFFRGDSTLLDHSSFINSLKRFCFLRWVYKYIDIAFYTGKSNHDYFHRYGLAKSQLVLAPHVVENERFLCNTESCNQLAASYRMQMNISRDHFVFLFAGKLEFKKDPDLLLQAFILEAFPENIHVVIVGNGELEKRLKSSYAKYPRVHFLNFQNQIQMPSVYQMANIFVLPSKGPGETWGLSVNEAMANGKPVIVSDKCGCARDLVEDGVNGYIFKATNINDLRKKLRIMYQRQDALQSMGEQSLNKIKQFSLIKVALGIEDIMIANKEILRRKVIE